MFACLLPSFDANETFAARLIFSLPSGLAHPGRSLGQGSLFMSILRKTSILMIVFKNSLDTLTKTWYDMPHVVGYSPRRMHHERLLVTRNNLFGLVAGQMPKSGPSRLYPRGAYFFWVTAGECESA